MARLAKRPYPGFEDADFQPGEDWIRAQQRLFEAIPQDRLLSFQKADSYAHYYVVSEKPLVLQHVPYMDAWTISPAEIRGMRLSDVREMLDRKRRLNELFKARSIA